MALNSPEYPISWLAAQNRVARLSGVGDFWSCCRRDVNSSLVKLVFRFSAALTFKLEDYLYTWRETHVATEISGLTPSCFRGWKYKSKTANTKFSTGQSCTWSDLISYLLADFTCYHIRCVILKWTATLTTQFLSYRRIQLLSPVSPSAWYQLSTQQPLLNWVRQSVGSVTPASLMLSEILAHLYVYSKAPQWLRSWETLIRIYDVKGLSPCTYLDSKSENADPIVLNLFHFKFCTFCSNRHDHIIFWM